MVAKLRLTVPTRLLDELAQLAQARGLQTGRLCRQFIDEGIARAQREGKTVAYPEVVAKRDNHIFPDGGAAMSGEAPIENHTPNGAHSGSAPLGDAEADLEALRQRAIAGDAAAEGAYVRLVGEKWIRLREVLDEAEGRMCGREDVMKRRMHIVGPTSGSPRRPVKRVRKRR
jgi:hypothetical protein